MAIQKDKQSKPHLRQLCDVDGSVVDIHDCKTPLSEQELRILSTTTLFTFDMISNI